MAFGFEISFFAELADALQNNGWAVLTYEKRTCGTFNGCADNNYPLPEDDLIIEASIDDAWAGIDFPRQRPEIDSARVSIVGHSQGAQFITLMLEADPQLAIGVMSAGPYGPPDEIAQTQLDSTVALLGQLGVSEEEALASAAVAPLVEMVIGLADIRSRSDEPVASPMRSTVCPSPTRPPLSLQT